MPITPNSRRKGVKGLRENYQDRRISLGIGTVFNVIGWGENGWGQLGLNERAPRSSPIWMPGSDWVHMAHSEYETYAVRLDGTLWAWGYNANGQLGQNNTIGYSSPVQVTSATDWADFSQIEGHYQNQWRLLKKRNGTWWGVGYNGYGQLGQNDTINRSSPVQIGINTTGPGAIGAKVWDVICANNNTVIAIANTDQTLWAWGRGDQGQFGLVTTKPNYSNPVQINTDKWIDVAAGGNTIVGIKTDGTIWAMGQNNYGQLGQNDTVYRSSPIQLGSTTGWTKVVVEGDHVAAVRSGNLWTWGRNDYGQLGLGDQSPRSSPNQASYGRTNGMTRDVFVGLYRTYAKVGIATITGYNQYYGMGYDNNFQLIPDSWQEGTNDFPRSSPTPIGPNWTNYFYNTMEGTALEYPEWEFFFGYNRNTAINKP